MKKFVVLLLLITVCGVSAQNETKKDVKDAKYEFSIVGKLGTGRYIETGSAPLNGFIQGGDVLISRKISKKYSLETGLSLLQFDGNQSIGTTNYSLRNQFLQIPLKFRGDINATTNNFISISYALGIYGSYHLNQEIETSNDKYKAKYLGWNMGLNAKIGVNFNIDKNVKFGLGFESLSDFTKFKKDNAEHNLTEVNTVYFNLGFAF